MQLPKETSKHKNTASRKYQCPCFTWLHLAAAAARLAMLNVHKRFLMPSFPVSEFPLFWSVRAWLHFACSLHPSLVCLFWETTSRRENSPDSGRWGGRVVGRGVGFADFYAGFGFQRCTSVPLQRVWFKCRGTSFMRACVYTGGSCMPIRIPSHPCITPITWAALMPVWLRGMCCPWGCTYVRSHAWHSRLLSWDLWRLSPHTPHLPHHHYHHHPYHCWLNQQRASWLVTHSHLFSLKGPLRQRTSWSSLSVRLNVRKTNYHHRFWCVFPVTKVWMPLLRLPMCAKSISHLLIVKTVHVLYQRFSCTEGHRCCWSQSQLPWGWGQFIACHRFIAGSHRNK